jgi:hypothetical protein
MHIELIAIKTALWRGYARAHFFSKYLIAQALRFGDFCRRAGVWLWSWVTTDRC